MVVQYQWLIYNYTYGEPHKGPRPKKTHFLLVTNKKLKASKMFSHHGCKMDKGLGFKTLLFLGGSIPFLIDNHGVQIVVLIHTNVSSQQLPSALCTLTFSHLHFLLIYQLCYYPLSLPQVVNYHCWVILYVYEVLLISHINGTGNSVLDLVLLKYNKF